MTDLDAIAREQAAGAAAGNGRDPLVACGLLALTSGADLGDVAVCLRQLVPLLPADPLDRRVIRDRAIAALKWVQIPDAAGLVDAALPRPAAAADMQGQAVAFADSERCPEPVDGAELLERLRRLVVRYLDLPAGADVLLAAFALYTYAAEGFAAAPYLVAHSPAPQCGKTRLLEVLALLVRRPWLTIVPSTAVLFRVLEEHSPTLLLDEAEVVRGRGDAAQDVRALLQSGYRRGAFVPRCVGDANEVRNFRVFGAKVFALIGELPAALFDRCIPIEMQRRARGQSRARFKVRKVEPEALELRRMARRWAEDHMEALRTVEIPALDFLDERAEEVWEPLLAVGRVAGGDWYDRLQTAAGRLSGGRSTTSVGVELLADIRAVFDDRRADRVASEDLAAALARIEGRRWPEWSRGRPISSHAVARLLKPFGVAATSDGETRGYKREYFATAWAQYLEPSMCQESSNDGTKPGSTKCQPGLPTDTSQTPENPHGDYTPDTLTVQMQGGPGLEANVPLGEPELDLDDGDEAEPDDLGPDAAPDAGGADSLIVTALGGDRYEVTGGAEPHVVELVAGGGVSCDCADHSYCGHRRACRHVVAVHRYLEAPDEAARAAMGEGA